MWREVFLTAMFTCRVISFWHRLEGRPFWIMARLPRACGYWSLPLAGLFC